MFKRLNWRRLPRVMVKCLALNEQDHDVIWDDLLKMAERSGERWTGAVSDAGSDEDTSTRRLTAAFRDILDLSQFERAAFAKAFDRLLDSQGDLFGTEGQLDPRGGRRD